AQEDFSNLQGKTLLIISEENEDIHILRRYLELEGVNILQVASGTQGIVSLVDCRENNKRNCNIDAVLIARELPDMKAWDLLAALRAISATKELPLALITSRLSHDNESSSSSFTARINKPFRKRELLHTISDMLKEKEITLPEQSSLMRSNDSIMEQGSGYKLLIVEDNEINYQFLSKYLMTKGFRCDVAVNGKDAVEAFKKQKYDLIFMDCQMPVMDGFEATKQIRRIQGEGAHTPIIAMTAYSLESDDKKCFAAGMDEFISKPVDVNKINKILDKYAIVNKNKDEAYEEMERQLSHEMLSPGRRQRVLIVDDMPTNISLLAAALDEDYDIRVATSGREALVLAHSTNPPDIILLDIRMPDLDGYEVFSKLSNEADTRDIPVIFLTGICEAQSEEYGLKLGAIDYIKKPFSIPIVKAKIKNHLELKQYKDFLRENTWLDQLTQIANRRRFDEMWALEVKRSKRLGSFLSLLMIDIDKFKDYNDTYGHLQGDECLRRVAAVIKSTARRPGDLAARWGGEEFLCLLPDTDPKGAREIAERTRQAVLDLGLEHSATDMGIVTVSVGVVTSDAECENCYDELIKRVDSALYHAKESGRNRVSMWGEF
ncbi:MAG TPA: response regulator, partial [Oscillospiraceae bacterium]|nr:response regulator [Oscillospiraceae bacterium]